MQRLGVILIVVSFLSGAYLTALDERQMDWAPFAVVLLAGIVGVVLVRRAAKAAAMHEEHQSVSVETLQTSLEHAVVEVGALDEERDSIDVYDLKDRIDERVRAHLDAFAEAREVVAHRYGLQEYADLMNRFAAGERYLNRVWSASTDGYIDEAHTYLARAREQFEDTRKVLDRLVSTSDSLPPVASATP